MTITRCLLGAALLLVPPLVPSSAYQPPVAAPGGTQACSVFVANDGEGPRWGSARVRVRGHDLFASPRQSAVRGEWVEIPELILEGGEERAIQVDLPVPERVPPVIEAEISGTRGLRWLARLPGPRGCVLVEPSTLPAEPPRIGREPVPFRILAGGNASVYTDRGQVKEEAADTAEEWQALRADFGVLAPDLWDLQPAETGPSWPYGYQPAHFASPSPPDMVTETVLGIRTPGHDVLTIPRGLWIRSVERREDGSVLCRYSYRYRRIPQGNRAILLIMLPGQYVLVAIPKADGPVVFRRVP